MSITVKEMKEALEKYHDDEEMFVMLEGNGLFSITGLEEYKWGDGPAEGKIKISAWAFV